MSQEQEPLSPESSLLIPSPEAARGGVDHAEVRATQIAETGRSKMEKLLAGPAAPVARVANGPVFIASRSHEVNKLIESLRLEEGYAEAMETQRFFPLLSKVGKKAPDFGQVLNVFSSKMLMEAQSFQTPTLILITPDLSFNDLVDIMNGRRALPGQNDANVHHLYLEHGTMKPGAWGAYITDGAAEMDAHGLDFDDIRLNLGKRVDNFDDYKKDHGISGMDRLKQIHLIMRHSKDGQPIDSKFWTIMAEDPARSTKRIPFVKRHPSKDYRQVDFNLCYSDAQNEHSRFRRSVGGEVTL